MSWDEACVEILTAGWANAQAWLVGATMLVALVGLFAWRRLNRDNKYEDVAERHHHD